MTTRYGVVFVTASSRPEAEAIATALIQSQLAACVSFTPIHSMYTWEGKVCSDEEWQLIIKTDLNQFAALEATVLSLHSYEVPEMIALPIVTGSSAYLNWMGTMVKSD
jgi:periplasmic divalent cation tolerance protein